MAKNYKSILEILEEEDKLLKDKEMLSSKIVNALYHREDLENESRAKNKDEIERLTREIDEMKAKESYVENRLKEIYSSIRYRIHHLFD